MGVKNTTKTSQITRRENRKEKKNRRYRQLAYFINDLIKDEKAIKTLPEHKHKHGPKLDETPEEDGNKGEQTDRTEEELSDPSSNAQP